VTATASAFPPNISADDIMTVVSYYFGVPIADLLGATRIRSVVDARQSGPSSGHKPRHC
jgi:chromosomal replication initiation ATPase DnaA